LKRLLLIAPLAAATAACATEDLEAFSYGLNQFSYELDSQMNPPCPSGMYRNFVSQWASVQAYNDRYNPGVYGAGYAPNPAGGYSYCVADTPIVYPYDGHHRGGGNRDRRGDDDGYAGGYRDGYRDGQRDD
jgi:hypothetical protein